MSANFAQASMENADFTNANLTNASFSGGGLYQANLTGATIQGASFILLRSHFRSSIPRAVIRPTTYPGSTWRAVSIRAPIFPDKI